MGAVLLIIIVSFITLIAAALIQERAKWRREERADEEWIATLQEWNGSGEFRNLW